MHVALDVATLGEVSGFAYLNEQSFARSRMYSTEKSVLLKNVGKKSIFPRQKIIVLINA
jgi:hypothetical protein